MKQISPVPRLVKAWDTNNKINLLLIASLPLKGFSVMPALSGGRTVREQLMHMNNVRKQWLYYYKTGNRQAGGRSINAKHTKAEIKKMFTASGKEINDFIKLYYAEKTNPGMFGEEIVNWIGYLISLESHYRGPIMLALKQSDIKISNTFSIKGVAGTWMQVN